MKNLVALSLVTVLVALTNPTTAEAKRYVVPDINDVHVEIGDHESLRGDTLNPDSIKIFTWNMYKGDKSSWKRDYEAITRNHDILLLQEIYLDWQMASTFYEDDDYYYKVAKSFIDTKNRDAASGVGIASNKVMSTYFSQRSHYREPFIKTPKMVMLANFRLLVAIKELLVATIHAINFVSAKKLRHQLREVAKEIARHDGPAVWGGDFNTWSKKKMRYMREVMKSVGLTKVNFPDEHEHMKVFKNYLDYVWYKGLEVVNSSVYGHIRGSDHKAMSTEFRLAQ